MRVLFIENSVNSPGGLFQKYLVSKHRARILKFDRNQIDCARSALSDVNLVVILGSPESVNCTDFQWINEELSFVKEVIALGRPLLGICFGAQMIARAIGGVVMPMKLGCHGWYENEVVVDSRWRGPWLRWHSEQIILPAAATILASSKGVVQAFQFGLTVGLQFHPEAEQDCVANWRTVQDIKHESLKADKELLMLSIAEWNDASRDRAYVLFKDILRRIRFLQSATGNPVDPVFTP